MPTSRCSATKSRARTGPFLWQSCSRSRSSRSSTCSCRSASLASFPGSTLLGPDGSPTAQAQYVGSLVVELTWGRWRGNRRDAASFDDRLCIALRRLAGFLRAFRLLRRATERFCPRSPGCIRAKTFHTSRCSPSVRSRWSPACSRSIKSSRCSPPASFSCKASPRVIALFRLAGDAVDGAVSYAALPVAGARGSHRLDVSLRLHRQCHDCPRSWFAGDRYGRLSHHCAVATLVAVRRFSYHCGFAGAPNRGRRRNDAAAVVGMERLRDGYRTRLSVFTVAGRPFFVYGAAYFTNAFRASAGPILYARTSDSASTRSIFTRCGTGSSHPKRKNRISKERPTLGETYSAPSRCAAQLGLKVVLSPGPVIRNEWRNGGYPAWLLERPEYNMPLHDVLDGRYPATATLQNTQADAAADEWLRNATHLERSQRWLLPYFEPSLRTRTISSRSPSTTIKEPTSTTTLGRRRAGTRTSIGCA